MWSETCFINAKHQPHTLIHQVRDRTGAGNFNKRTGSDRAEVWKESKYDALTSVIICILAMRVLPDQPVRMRSTLHLGP
jgi:hypothetical protein